MLLGSLTFEAIEMLGSRAALKPADATKCNDLQQAKKRRRDWAHPSRDRAST
jgi:hypothetical protein